MIYTDCMSNANTAFAGGQYETCLEYSKQAMKLEPTGSEPYYSAGKACMSMGRAEEAVTYFREATTIDKNNGNGFFLLGYAQAMAGDTVGSLKSLTKALESNCDETLKGQIYKIIAMINNEQGDYNNALINLGQAESFVGLDYEILQQKAACYASLSDYHQALFTLNQMKLLQPNVYLAYNLAFHIFMELGIYDEAKAELDRAKEYANLDMMYYNDCIAYTLLHDPDKDTAENVKDKWQQTIRAIAIALKEGLPNVEQVLDLYIRAAQMYISMEKPDEAICVLDASADPVRAYNSGFSVVVEGDDAGIEVGEEEMSPEDEEELLEKRYEDGEFDELAEDIRDVLRECDEEDADEVLEELERYLSPLDKVPKVEETIEQHILVGPFEMAQLQQDMRNALYLSAYEMKRDYDMMLRKARELQSSSILANQYSGIYYELKVGKLTGDEKWRRKYQDRINFWTKRMLEDPTDYLSANYRIRSYIDIGDYENAEILCSCMPNDIKDALQEEIAKAKKQEV